MRRSTRRTSAVRSRLSAPALSSGVPSARRGVVFRHDGLEDGDWRVDWAWRGERVKNKKTKRKKKKRENHVAAATERGPYVCALARRLLFLDYFSPSRNKVIVLFRCLLLNIFPFSPCLSLFFNLLMSRALVAAIPCVRFFFFFFL